MNSTIVRQIRIHYVAVAVLALAIGGGAAPHSEAQERNSNETPCAVGYPCSYTEYGNEYRLDEVRVSDGLDDFVFQDFVCKEPGGCRMDAAWWLGPFSNGATLPATVYARGVWHRKGSASNGHPTDTQNGMCQFQRSVEESMATSLSVGLSLAATVGAKPFGIGAEITVEASVETGLEWASSGSNGSDIGIPAWTLAPFEKLNCWVADMTVRAVFDSSQVTEDQIFEAMRKSPRDSDWSKAESVYGPDGARRFYENLYRIKAQQMKRVRIVLEATYTTAATTDVHGTTTRLATRNP